jgi:uncharacterized protein (TIGR02145 family)
MNKIVSIKLPILALAMVFTISCSSDSEDSGKNPVQGGENSNVSNEQSSSSVVAPPSSSSFSSVQSSSSDIFNCGSPMTVNSEIVANSEYVTGCVIPEPRFKDERDGKYYFLVEIGTQTWMSQNLNYETGDSKCYGGNPENCQIYGRLYDWATAMKLSITCNVNSCADKVQPKHQGICPNGWHLPSKAEWEKLITAVGGAATAGKYLKASLGWDNDGNGEDKYDFWALPGGIGMSMGDFYGVGEDGAWWSTSEYDDFNAYRLHMYDYDEGADLGYFGKDLNSYSIRCVKDN